MRLSNYFLPTLKEKPAEAKIVSHTLMLRAGMIRQSSAGIYSWLPLGIQVLKKIENIVREEQVAAGALEILMPTIQSADLWRESGRYDDYGKEMLRITDRHDRGLLYGPTNEELVTDIFRNNVRSYKDLPLNLFHIQWKFRDEIRPRFGVMRGREFLMKDNYSFDIDEESARHSYKKMFLAYMRTFKRMELNAIPMAADTGPIGGDLSHEFLVIADTGESEVFFDSEYEVFFDRDFSNLDIVNSDIDYDDKDSLDALLNFCNSTYAATDEKHDPDADNIVPERLVQGRGIEVGHIFYFGDKYSKAMGANVQGSDGKPTEVQMGSYGIGVSRLVGAIIESSHDENGIIWPESVAPYRVGIINLRQGDEATDAACESLYKTLNDNDVEVLYDDRDERAGGKFSNMDLIGIPWQVVIGPRGLKNGLLEVKHRKSGERFDMSIEDIIAKFTS